MMLENYLKTVNDIVSEIKNEIDKGKTVIITDSLEVDKINKLFQLAYDGKLLTNLLSENDLKQLQEQIYSCEYNKINDIAYSGDCDNGKYKLIIILNTLLAFTDKSLDDGLETLKSTLLTLVMILLYHNKQSDYDTLLNFMINLVKENLNKGQEVLLITRSNQKDADDVRDLLKALNVKAKIMIFPENIYVYINGKIWNKDYYAIVDVGIPEKIIFSVSDEDLKKIIDLDVKAILKMTENIKDSPAWYIIKFIERRVES